MKDSKSPREVLLERHLSAERKLDKIRVQVLRECFGPADSIEIRRSRFEQAWHKLYLEIFAPAKTTWAAVAAAWLLILGFNLANRLPPKAIDSPRARTKQPAGDIQIAFREQAQLLRELIGPVEPSRDLNRPRPKAMPQPRSLGIQKWTTV